MARATYRAELEGRGSAHRKEGESHPPAVVFQVGVQEEEGLPGAEQGLPAQNRNRDRGAEEGREEVVRAMAGGTVPVARRPGRSSRFQVARCGPPAASACGGANQIGERQVGHETAEAPTRGGPKDHDLHPRAAQLGQ